MDRPPYIRSDIFKRSYKELLMLFPSMPHKEEEFINLWENACTSHPPAPDIAARLYQYLPHFGSIKRSANEITHGHADENLHTKCIGELLNWLENDYSIRLVDADTLLASSADPHRDVTVAESPQTTVEEEVKSDCFQPFNAADVKRDPRSVLKCMRKRVKADSTAEFHNVKFENFRQSLIRAMKRSIRKISVNSGNFSHSMRECYERNREELDMVSNTENGPVVDARNRRRSQGVERTYNRDYCRKLFQNECVMSYYRLFLEYQFNKETNKRCKRLNLYCCSSGNHSEQCSKVWSVLHEFLTKEFCEI